MNESFKSVESFGFRVFNDELSKIPVNGEKCRAINCSISPNNYGLAVKDPHFRSVLHNTDYLVLDGVYFALASILLKGKNIKRNQGPDVYKHFIARANDMAGRVFFLGSSTAVLEKIQSRLSREFPNIEVMTYSPPFKAEFSQSDNDEMCKAINSFKPDIVFVGMTAPKQEKWSDLHKDRLNAGLIVSIGNVFDWYAGTQKEIHPIYFKLRIGWLVRIFLRPEVFRRNIGNQMLFFWHLFLTVVCLRKEPKLQVLPA